MQQYLRSSNSFVLPCIHYIFFNQVITNNIFLVQVINNNIQEALQFCTVLHTLLMITAESMLSKRPVLRITVVLLFLLKLFSSHIYCIPKYISFIFIKLVMIRRQLKNGEGKNLLFVEVVITQSKPSATN